MIKILKIAIAMLIIINITSCSKQEVYISKEASNYLNEQSESFADIEKDVSIDINNVLNNSEYKVDNSVVEDIQKSWENVEFNNSVIKITVSNGNNDMLFINKVNSLYCIDADKKGGFVSLFKDEVQDGKLVTTLVNKGGNETATYSKDLDEVKSLLSEYLYFEYGTNSNKTEVYKKDNSYYIYDELDNAICVTIIKYEDDNIVEQIACDLEDDSYKVKMIVEVNNKKEFQKLSELYLASFDNKKLKDESQKVIDEFKDQVSIVNELDRFMDNVNNY